MNQDRLEQQTAAIATLEAQARQRTATLIARGQRLIGRALPLPKILFDLRGQTAGQVPSMAVDAAPSATIWRCSFVMGRSSWGGPSPMRSPTM